MVPSGGAAFGIFLEVNCMEEVAVLLRAKPTRYAATVKVARTDIN